MSRAAIGFYQGMIEAAYRGERYSALRPNLESVCLDEWEMRPANPSVGPDSEFGMEPELSICDLVAHVAGCKFMYADRMFGEARLEWGDIRPPSREMSAMLAWLDEGHRALAEGLAGLGDDSELQEMRPLPSRHATRIEHLLTLMINHDLYHSGEINRQRSLIRGSTGWESAAHS